MSEPFLSEIKVVPWNFPPKGWTFCNGQFLPINQNQALFSLLGTTYGGNGQTTFALPDLRGRIPVHMGGAHDLGERAGQEAHTLTLAEMPIHTHALSASKSIGNTSNPRPANVGAVLAADPGNSYGPPNASFVVLAAGTTTNVGGSQAHTNMKPFLALNFIIALQGIFPSQN